MAFTKIDAAGIRSTGTVTLEHVIVVGSLNTSNITGAASTENIRTNSLVVSGVTTSSGGFIGNVTGNATGLSGTPNIIVGSINSTGIITATTFSGSGASLTSIPNSATTATIANTASAIVARDASGNFSAGTITANLTGTASNVTTNANLTGHVTSVGNAAVLGSFTSANLAAALTDETGSGANVFATSPTLVTPILGAATGTSLNVSGDVTATQFATGTSGSAIGINTNTISGPATITIDPAAIGDNTGLVVIKGDLQIDGTTTTINSTTVTVDDKNIVLSSGAVNDAAADGSGITIESGNGNKTFQFEDTGDNLGSSENLNIASGKVYKVNNTSVLSSTTLGSGIVNSSLTSVGTLTNLNVGNINSSGIVTATIFVGALTGNAATVTTNANLTGDITSVGNATAIAAGVIVDADINASAGIVDTKLATIATALKVSNSATTATNANTASAIVARDASGNFSAGTITATSLVESSSITLKENISPIDNALDKILQLNPVTYDRKNNISKNEAGLIAEEVEKIIPNIVSKDGEGNPEGINYTKLTVYLIDAVKTLTKELRELKDGNS